MTIKLSLLHCRARVVKFVRFKESRVNVLPNMHYRCHLSCAIDYLRLITYCTDAHLFA